jgi:carbamoyltransferase
MITWGINALNHDASIAVVKDGELIFWKRSSEYTNVVGDQFLCRQLIQDATKAGGCHPNEVVWYENAWLKKTRQLYAGQYRWAFSYSELPKVYLKKLKIKSRNFK